MSANGHRLIAREGIMVLLALLVLGAVLYTWSGPLSSLPVALLFIIAAFLFRDPRCDVPAAPLAVLSPASGQVISVSKSRDPWLSRPAVRIRLQLSVWDAHGLRSPTEARVMNQWFSSGGDQEFRRQSAYWLQTDEGDDVLVALGMNNSALYTRMALYPGERIGQGQRCGFLYVSGIIDVYLPENSRTHIKVGERVHAGSAILGRFAHDNDANRVAVGTPSIQA